MRHLSDRELTAIRDKATDAAKLLGPYCAASTIFHKFSDDCIVRIRVSQHTAKEMYEIAKTAGAALEEDEP